MPVSPDPRVKHGYGPHPNMTAVTRLVSDVHAQLDMLGVPRAIEPCHDRAATVFCQECVPPGEYREGGELTLLGRVAALIDLLSPRIDRAAAAIELELDSRGGGDEFLESMDEDVRAELLTALAVKALAAGASA